jgi:hypothetical protein
LLDYNTISSSESGTAEHTAFRRMIHHLIESVGCGHANQTDRTDRPMLKVELDTKQDASRRPIDTRTKNR